MKTFKNKNGTITAQSHYCHISSLLHSFLSPTALSPLVQKSLRCRKLTNLASRLADRPCSDPHFGFLIFSGDIGRKISKCTVEIPGVARWRSTPTQLPMTSGAGIYRIWTGPRSRGPWTKRSRAGCSVQRSRRRRSTWIWGA